MRFTYSLILSCLVFVGCTSSKSEKIEPPVPHATPEPTAEPTATPTATPTPTPPPTPPPTPWNTIRADRRLLFDGDREFRVKGIDFVGCRDYPTLPKHANGVELAPDVVSWIFFCSESEIRRDLRFLKESMDINSIRILTPSVNQWDAFERYHKTGSWFQVSNPNQTAKDYLASTKVLKPSDGRITEAYALRLKKIFAAAKELGIRVQLGMFLNHHYFVPLNGPDGFDILKPGSNEELFYFHFIESIADLFRGDGTLLAYEVGLEAMLRTVQGTFTNFCARTYYEPKALSYITRLARKIKAVDPAHLVTDGEVPILPRPPFNDPNQCWCYPSPELAVLPDVDNLNGGIPFSVYDVVDFISPHPYLFGKDEGEPHKVVPEDVVTMVNKIIDEVKKKTVPKPVAFGESGYLHVFTASPLTQTQLEKSRRFYQLMIDTMNSRYVAGFHAWAPLPLLKFVPGTLRVFDEGGYFLRVEIYDDPANLGDPTHLIRHVYYPRDFQPMFDHNLQPYPVVDVLKAYWPPQ